MRTKDSIDYYFLAVLPEDGIGIQRPTDFRVISVVLTYPITVHLSVLII